MAWLCDCRRFANRNLQTVFPRILKFRRVTIRGAQPSARLSEEICLSEGSVGVSQRALRGSLQGLCRVSPGLLGNGRNTVSRVLFRRSELTEPHWVLRQTRWVLRKTRWVLVYTQIIGWEELTEFAPRNSVSPEKLTEFRSLKRYSLKPYSARVSGLCGGPRDVPRVFGHSDPMLVTFGDCWILERSFYASVARSIFWISEALLKIPSRHKSRHLYIRKLLVSVKFLSAILGPEMAAPILWTPRKNASVLQEKPCP